MVKFEKEVEKLLPYDRKEYINFKFLAKGFDSPTDWYGVSFQTNREKHEISLTDFIELYEPFFREVISITDSGASWIVNHDDKDLDWFPNDARNLSSLRSLFKQRGIPNSYKGALVLTKDDLFAYSKNLISYPHIVIPTKNVWYKDLDISHAEVPFIIKISGHLNIDLLSKDKMFLREIAHKMIADNFVIKEYNGTFLWQ